jgi:FtsP/CotA-like multicopper oxidase with cupredoxin domain
VDEPRDVNTGLIGPLVITARGKAKSDGTPKDVDREFVTLFMTFNENQSWYLDKNIETYTSDPKKVKKLDFKPVHPDGTLSFTGTGFAAANFRAAINGFQFANCPGLKMRKGERVRWYLLALGDALNLHTPHWHGNVVIQHGSRTDMVWMGPATMDTVDMVPDNPGAWMFHCHVSDHLEGGMHAHYQVLP